MTATQRLIQITTVGGAALLDYESDALLFQRSLGFPSDGYHNYDGMEECQ